MEQVGANLSWRALSVSDGKWREPVWQYLMQRPQVMQFSPVSLGVSG